MSSTEPTTNLFESAGAKQTATDFAPASDTIETNFGTLEFVGGSFPTAESAEKIYDELDLQRATQAYMDFYPALSVYGIVKAQIRDFGFKTSSDIGVFADFMHPSENYPHRQQQHRVRHRLARPQGRRSDRGGDPRGHDGQRQRRVLQVPHRLRSDRTRQGQGRQVPLRAPRVHGRRAERPLRRPLTELPDLGDDARLRRRHRRRRRAVVQGSAEGVPAVEWAARPHGDRTSPGWARTRWLPRTAPSTRC